MTQSIARVVVTSVVVLGFASLVRAQAPDGAELYKRTCAQCHDTGANRAPARDAFQSMPAERVMAAMETGSMITMAIGRTADERKAIAEFLTGKSLSNPVVLAARAGSHVSRGIALHSIQRQGRAGPAGDRTRTTHVSRMRERQA